MSLIKRIDVTKRLSNIVIYNGTVFLAGQVADDTSLDIKGQTKDVLRQIDEALAEAGTDKSRLLTAQIWVKDIARDFEGMNEIWNAWTAPDAAPTRATAQCELANPKILVEIIVTAAAAS